MAVLCLVCAASFTAVAWHFSELTPATVAHAGGAYRGNLYTNSMEALDNSYRKGFRHFELDLLVNQEGNIVCGYHSKKGTRNDPGTTPCTGKLLQDWLLARPGTSIITDTKGSTKQLYKAILKMSEPVKEQIIVQTYKKSDYKAAKIFGFDRLYLSFYRHPDKEEENIALLKERQRDFEAVVIPHRKILTTGTKIRGLIEKHTDIYIHTINDRDTKRRIQKKYKYGVYTDTLTP